VQVGAAFVLGIFMKQNIVANANCAALAAVLFTTLIANICSEIENLRLCFSAEAEIVLNLFFKF